jgi:hypothetical protein
MNAKYSVVFNRKGKLNSQGKALIQIRVHFNQNTSEFVSTDIIYCSGTLGSEKEDNQRLPFCTLHTVPYISQLKTVQKALENYLLKDDIKIRDSELRGLARIAGASINTPSTGNLFESSDVVSSSLMTRNHLIMPIFSESKLTSSGRNKTENFSLNGTLQK